MFLKLLATAGSTGAGEEPRGGTRGEVEEGEREEGSGLQLLEEGVRRGRGVRRERS